MYSLRGQGGSPNENLFYAIVVEGKQSYQMLFTESKNIDPNLIYCIFKIAKYIQLLCGRTLYSFWARDLKLGSCLVYIIPNNFFSRIFELGPQYKICWQLCT